MQDFHKNIFGGILLILLFGSIQLCVLPEEELSVLFRRFDYYTLISIFVVWCVSVPYFLSLLATLVKNLENNRLIIFFEMLSSIVLAFLVLFWTVLTGKEYWVILIFLFLQAWPIWHMIKQTTFAFFDPKEFAKERTCSEY